MNNRDIRNPERDCKTVYIIDPASSEPKYGGFSRQYDYACELSKEGYNIVIISSGFSHFTHTYIANDKVLVNEVNHNFHYVYLKTLKYQSNNGIRRALNMAGFLFAILANEKEICQRFGKPDVAIGSSPHPMSWIAAEIISRKYDCLFCVDVRDFWPRIWVESGEKSKRNPLVVLMGLIQRHSFKKADRIFHSMKDGAGYICGELGFPKEKTFWIPQPMNCKRFDINKLRAENIPKEIREFIKQGFICTYSGYYMTYEGVYVMLEAAKLLKEKLPSVKMLFVGSGKEKEGMQKYAKQHDLSNVLIWDRIDKEAIPALLASSDVCMAHLEVKNHRDAYKYGASKNKIIEYLYSGTVTVYGCSFRNEVSDSHGGFIFEPYDEKALADLIERIYKMSPEERTAVAESGRKYIQNKYNSELLVKKLEKAIFQKS